MPRELHVAYFRVGTDRTGRLHLGPGAQHIAVAEYLAGGERELVGTYAETESLGRSERPQLARALAACRRLQATLIIARLDGLAHDGDVMFMIFGGSADCPVVFCDPPHVPTGWQGAARQGRDRAIRRAGAVQARLADQRAADILPVIRTVQASGVGTLQGIADALNTRGVRTARGGQWYPTTVRNLLRRDVRGLHPATADSTRFTGISSWRADDNGSRPGVLH